MLPKTSGQSCGLLTPSLSKSTENLLKLDGINCPKPKALNANGYNLEIDGRLGKNTLDAVRDAQSKRDRD